MVPAYWWDGHPNFGDGLTSWLLPHFGVIPVHRVPGRAEMVGVGSIIEHMPEDFSGVVWGSGLMHDEQRPLPGATVLAVRGELTRARTAAPADTPLGDPGLLVSHLMRRPPVRWRVGLVPHGHHRSNRAVLALAERYPRDVHLINVHGRTGSVVREIASCRYVISSSLHGVVVADAFGIPAAWTSLEPDLPGGTFKFRDHETVVGDDRFLVLDESSSLEDLLDQVRPADRNRVAAATGDLQRSAARLREHFADRTMPPPLALSRMLRS
ncbi:polysaccharide pyruvyl transferase family protein [Georgenia sp. M64]|uniref:polysaccharide pyruvyl transferase family protein n=1 Tax=Georgenia sp. M64 TaxID=3120520 RepID=UPI0030E54476